MNPCIPGPAGPLEIQHTAPPAGITAYPVTLVMCHPHPLQGGTMDNKVVTTLCRTCAQLGVGAIRFNFRGVGHSAGHYGHGIAETADLQAVVDWVRKTHAPDHQIWIGGFSFGGYVALASAAQIRPQLLIAVSPAVIHFDTSRIQPFGCPWVLIQGEQDTVIPAQQVRSYVAQSWADQPPHWINLPEADHFFHGQLITMRTALTPILQSHLSAVSAVSHPAPAGGTHTV